MKEIDLLIIQKYLEEKQKVKEDYDRPFLELPLEKNYTDHKKELEKLKEPSRVIVIDI